MKAQKVYNLHQQNRHHRESKKRPHPSTRLQMHRRRRTPFRDTPSSNQICPLSCRSIPAVLIVLYTYQLNHLLMHIRHSDRDRGSSRARILWSVLSGCPSGDTFPRGVCTAFPRRRKHDTHTHKSLIGGTLGRLELIHRRTEDEAALLRISSSSKKWIV